MKNTDDMTSLLDNLLSKDYSLVSDKEEDEELEEVETEELDDEELEDEAIEDEEFSAKDLEDFAENSVIDEEEVEESDEESEDKEELAIEEVKQNEDKEVLDELETVEEINPEEESEEIIEETEEVEDAPSPIEELKAFSKLEEAIDDFIINSDIDFSAHPKLKEFAVKYTEDLEKVIDELRQEKNDALFDEGVTASKRDKAIKADKIFSADKKIETALQTIADCLNNCSEIDLVDINNDIIKNAQSFVIDFNNGDSFEVKLNYRGKTNY